MNNANKYLYTDGSYIYINTDRAEAYIPENMIGDVIEKKSSICYEYGTGYMTLGVMDMRFFDSNDKVIADKTLIYPNMIETRPNSSDSNVYLDINGNANKYRVLHYDKGDILMPAQSKQSADNVTTFLKLLLSGNIPKALDYESTYKAWIKNIAINKINPGVPDVMLQAVIATMCRYNKDNSVQFRKVYGNPGVSKDDYTFLSGNEVTSAASVLTALSFERYGDKLATSITMSKEGKVQDISPVEQVITM